jgi:hypothetical protein
VAEALSDPRVAFINDMRLRNFSSILHANRAR